MDFVISILLKLALTVVKGVICDVICVKCKKKYTVVSFISVKWHIKVRKANPKTKILNAYFQHILYYKSERKDLKH